jgi:hypothetical protein
MLKAAFGRDHSKNTNFELLKRIKDIKVAFCERSSFKSNLGQEQNVLLQKFVPT